MFMIKPGASVRSEKVSSSRFYHYNRLHLGIYAPDRSALPGEDITLIGNRENATIAHSNIAWYFPNGNEFARYA